MYCRLTIFIGDKNAYIHSTDIGTSEKELLQEGMHIDRVLGPNLILKNKTKDMPDLMGHGSYTLVVSDRLKKVLEENSMTGYLQFFKCRIQNSQTKISYWLLNITECSPAMDRTKSIYTTFKKYPDEVDEITSLVFAENELNGKHIFRIKEAFGHLFISEQLKTKLIENKMTGIRFIKNMDLTTNAAAE